MRNKTLESRIYRKIDVRFGGGSSEKARVKRDLAGGLPCGLASTPTVCADCPNLHLLQAVARHGTGGG